jgi:hypothetical protein
MQKVEFSNLEKMLEQDGEALVLLGCDISGDNESGWVNGITSFLKDQNCIEEDFKKIVYTETTGGRIDLIFFLPEKINIGKLAIVRLSMFDCSWLSDYLLNYKDQHAA